MNLRNRILLFLFLLGLLPVVATVFYNMPMVFDWLGRYYHQAHLQTLRADFRDLDQHLASRYETVRFLARIPEPGMLINNQNNDTDADASKEQARDQFKLWLSRFLRHELDITNISYIDISGHPTLELQRDYNTGIWIDYHGDSINIEKELINTTLAMPPGSYLTSPINITNTGTANHKEPSLFLQLGSPIYEFDNLPPVGAVFINIDIGGMAHSYRQTYWVFDNGNYLTYSRPQNASKNAFEDFPGLEAIFKGHTLALWQHEDADPIIWVPMFPTKQGDPLWVGRQVDPSPLVAFQREIIFRVLVIVIFLIIVVLFLASRIANTYNRFHQQLTRSISHVLNGDESVEFPWRGPAELKQLAANLSQLAESHANKNNELRVHAQQLERSNQYKSEFLANVSHELRTPLNSILLLSKMMGQNAQLPSEHIQQAKVINKAGQDLKILIDDILDLSKIEAQRFDVYSEKVHLPTLLESLKELVQPQFDEKNLFLSITIDPECQQNIESDSEKLRQILKNFLSNAVKFTNTGTITLALKKTTGTAALQHPISICVSDPGIGIAKNHQEHIFEAFRQADGSTSRRYGGTGLGLAICQKLANLLSAEITLESDIGQGAKFCLLLPLAIEATTTPDEPMAAPESPSPIIEAITPAADFSGKQLLIVDNDLQTLLDITPTLETQGITVTAATDGQEAQENLDEDLYDIILVNLQASDGAGSDLIRQIRQHPNYHNTPIIALHQTTIDDKQPGTNADGHLQKPLQNDALLAALEEFLKKKKEGGR